MALDLEPFTFLSGYVKLDGRLAITIDENTWEIALVGRNLTNKITKNFANDANAFGTGHIARLHRYFNTTRI